jgi:hypothetical protein
VSFWNEDDINSTATAFYYQTRGCGMPAANRAEADQVCAAATTPDAFLVFCFL